MSPVKPCSPIDVQLQSVLLATDFSPVSEKPLQHAVALARHYGAKLFLFHVVGSLGLTLAGPDASLAARTLAWKEAALLERKLVLSGALRDLRHQVIIREGDIRQELEKVIRQEHIDLVVVGTHSRKGVRRLVLGSVAEQIFRCASCLVLTVGPLSPVQSAVEASRTRPVLFATDFSAASLRALPYAASFAGQRGTRLALLHVLSPVPHLEGNRWYTAGDVENLRTEVQQTARRRLGELTARLGLTVDPLLMAEFGEPAEGILRAADALHAEVITLGLKGQSAFDSLAHLRWSIAYQVACAAACPVLTIRDG
jgi:nucleotide-binding universal stress UspA family protein